MRPCADQEWKTCARSAAFTAAPVAAEGAGGVVVTVSTSDRSLGSAGDRRGEPLHPRDHRPSAGTDSLYGRRGGRGQCVDVGAAGAAGEPGPGAPEGTGVRLAVVRAPDGDGGRLVVEDDGPGFPEGHVPERGRSGGGSTGLGLDIVRRAAQEAGGAVEFTRAPGGGARVTAVFGGEGARVERL
ncbi:sensor histidine kinase, partial [Streptomyces benahoarensis]